MSTPAASAVFADSVLDSRFLAAQRQDVAAVLVHLDVESLHAAVVDVVSLSFEGTYAIAGNGAISEIPSDLELDSVFPGASSTVTQLTSSAVSQTRLHKLGPRRWLLAWRVDDLNAVVAVAHFHTRRDDVGDIAAALIRFVCDTSIRSRGPALPSDASVFQPVWPQVERRQHMASRRFVWPMLALLLVAAACAAWIALVAAPAARDSIGAHQTETRRLRTLSETTFAHDLSLALATGDYGDVQTALASFSQRGYFQGAVVTNATYRIVAASGAVDRQRIGDGVTPAFAKRAQTLDLRLGAQALGQVVFVSAPPPADVGRLAAGMVPVAALGCALALGAAGWLAVRTRRPRRPEADVQAALEPAAAPTADVTARDPPAADEAASTAR